MITKLKSALTVGALVATAGGVAVFLAAGDASAQGTPSPWAPGGVSQDGNAVSGLTFFNAAGQQITSGSTSTAPFAAFVQGRALARTTPVDTKATLFGFVPVVGQTPDTWSSDETLGVGTNYPNAAAPAPLNTSTLPLFQGAAGNESLDTLASDLPNSSSTTGYAGVYEIRMLTSSTGHGSSTGYDYADISINSTTHTWSLVFTPGQQPTSTTLTASPNPADTTTAVTLTATEAAGSAVAAGSVQFSSGGVPFGSPVPVNGTTGVATITQTTTSIGTFPISAVFTPTDTTDFAPSTSNTVNEVITAPKVHTAAVTAVSGGNLTTGSDATVTVTVTDADGSAPAGTVALSDNGAALTGASAPTTVQNTAPNSEVFTYDVPAGFATGAHAVSAIFTPTNTTTFGTSPQSNVVTFSTNPALQGACVVTPANCTDTQTITGTVPAGTIIITTPYTATAPLSLGTLVLAQDPGNGTLQFSASAPFANIKIVDTRAGDLPYTVMAQSSNLTDGTGHTNGVINSQNVGLTAVTGVGSGGFSGVPSFTQNPAANPAVAPGVGLGAAGDQGLGLVPHTVGGVDHGAGTFTFNGLLTLNAPSSTEPNLYTGTIVFTVG